jgi:hypothetical protein
MVDRGPAVGAHTSPDCGDYILAYALPKRQ